MCRRCSSSAGLRFTGSGALGQRHGDGQGGLEAPAARGGDPDRRLGDAADATAGRSRSSAAARRQAVERGSTVGLTLVQGAEELDDAIALALAVDHEVMLERFLPGREFTVGILGERGAGGGRDRPAARDLRLRVQVHPGDDARGLPGRDPRRAGARDARPRAWRPTGHSSCATSRASTFASTRPATPTSSKPTPSPA